MTTRKIEGPRKVGLFSLNHLARLLARKRFETAHNLYFRIVQVSISTVFVLLGICYWTLYKLCCISFARRNLKVPRRMHVGLFMFHIHTKFSTPTFFISTVTVTKPKNKQNLYHTAIFLVYILQKLYIIGASEKSWMSNVPHIMDNVLTTRRESQMKTLKVR